MNVPTTHRVAATPRYVLDSTPVSYERGFQVLASDLVFWSVCFRRRGQIFLGTGVFLPSLAG